MSVNQLQESRELIPSNSITAVLCHQALWKPTLSYRAVLCTFQKGSGERIKLSPGLREATSVLPELWQYSMHILEGNTSVTARI